MSAKQPLSNVKSFKFYADINDRNSDFVENNCSIREGLDVRKAIIDDAKKLTHNNFYVEVTYADGSTYVYNPPIVESTIN